MNDDYGWGIRLAIVAFLVGVFIGVALGFHKGKVETQQQAIECGAAQYNSQTAKFEWKEEVGE